MRFSFSESRWLWRKPQIENSFFICQITASEPQKYKERMKSGGKIWYLSVSDFLLTFSFSAREDITFPCQMLFSGFFFEDIFFAYFTADFRSDFTENFYLVTMWIELLQKIVKIFLFKLSKFPFSKLSKFSFFKLSNFPFSNCQNFPFQNCQNFPFSNCQNYPLQTVKILLFQTVKIFLFQTVKIFLSKCQCFPRLPSKATNAKNKKRNPTNNS